MTRSSDSIRRSKRCIRSVAALGCAAVCLIGPRLDGDVVINEILALNRFTNFDEYGTSSDWVELVNTGSGSVDLGGFWISDDPRLPRKWQFPKVSIAAGGHRLVWCSGRSSTNPPGEIINDTSSDLPFTATLVSLDAEWRYLTGAPGDAAPPAEWFQDDFDDSGWASGTPGFGYGSAGLRTEFPTEVSVALLRHVFHVDDPDRIPNLVLRALFDDGFVAYLNGVRVLDVFYGDDTAPSFDSTSNQSHEATERERFDISGHRSLLRAGGNVLAIALLNRNARSSDLLIDPELGEVGAILHTSFKLDGGGDAVIVSDPTGNLVDVVLFPRQASDRSYGRFPNASGEFSFMLRPTPGVPNGDLVAAELIPNEIDFTPTGGVLEDPLEVALSAAIPFAGFEIRYSLDGSVPTAGSRLYEGPIAVTNNRVIRAIGFLDGRPVTHVITENYLVNTLTHRLDLPIISIAMNPRLFREVHSGAAEEEPAHMEIFDASGVPQTETGFGIRLHGGVGRRGDFETKKAYRAYFRGIYGDRRLEYPIIPDTDVTSFDKLVLRSGSNDAFRSGRDSALIRDQLIRDLHEEMGGVVSHGSWYNLFVNGDYRGLYNVVERMDRKFFESYFPEDGDNWDIIKQGSLLDGTADEWRDFTSFIQEARLVDNDAFEEVHSLLDVECFTRYMILQVWGQNHDWPGNNWYSAKAQNDGGRWIFLVWDAEFAIGRNADETHPDSFNRLFEQTGNIGAPAADVFAALFANRGYQQFFLEELDRQFAGVLSPDNVTAHIDRLAAMIEPDVPEEAVANGSAVPWWEAAIEKMRDFAASRNDVIKSFIVNSPALSRDEASFVRGDADANGRLTISDAVTILRRFSFGGNASEPPCLVALDVDDSESINISDAAFLLEHLFRIGSPSPPAPFPTCGVDPTPSAAMSCAGPTACP